MPTEGRQHDGRWLLDGTFYLTLDELAIKLQRHRSSVTSAVLEAYEQGDSELSSFVLDRGPSKRPRWLFADSGLPVAIRELAADLAPPPAAASVDANSELIAQLQQTIAKQDNEIEALKASIQHLVLASKVQLDAVGALSYPSVPNN